MKSIAVNLLPQEFRTPEKKKFALADLIQPKRLLMLLLFIGAAEISLWGWDMVIDGPRFARMQKNFSALSSPLKAVRVEKLEAGGLQEENRVLKARMERPLIWTNLLSNLTDAMDQGVWLESLKVEERRIQRAVTPAAAPVQPASAPAKSKPAKPVKGAKPEPAAAKPKAPAPAKGNKETFDMRRAITLEGRMISRGEGAAVAGQMIHDLKSSSAWSTVMEDVVLDQLMRADTERDDIFQFTLVGIFKPDLEKEFLETPSAK